MSKINELELCHYLKDHTNEEAASHFSVSIRTIVRHRKKHSLSHGLVKYGILAPLSKRQINIVIGSLLGDGHINKSTPRFGIGQKSSNKEYVTWVFDNLAPYSLNLYEDTGVHPSWRMYTMSHEIFSSYRNQWYDNVKIIPKDLILNEEILTHWYVQDGSNNQKKKSLRISTQGFSVENTEFLASAIQRDLGLKATINYAKGKPTLHIGSDHYLQFLLMVKPYLEWSCFQYKLDTSKANVSFSTTIGISKLNMEKAEQIRELHSAGRSVKELSEMFGVTESSIYKVTNNETYVKTQEYADVKVIYNPLSAPAILLTSSFD